MLPTLGVRAHQRLFLTDTINHGDTTSTDPL